MKIRHILALGLLALAGAKTASADPVWARWTGSEDKDAEFAHVLSVLNQKTDLSLSESDFRLLEDRDLAFGHYRRYSQFLAGSPIRGRSIRVWTNRSNELVQAEASVEPPKQVQRLVLSQLLSPTQLRQGLSIADASRLIQTRIAKSAFEDRRVGGITWATEWDPSLGTLVRAAKVRARRGVHRVVVSLATRQVVSHEYGEFPQADIAVKAQVFPIYEEVEGTGEILTRIPAQLKYIQGSVPDVSDDPFGTLRERRYLDEMYDPVLGETEAGQAQGYWSMSWVKREAAKIRATIPLRINTLDSKAGLLLQGKYATINLHPDAVKEFTGIDFKPGFSANFYPFWKPVVVEGNDTWEMIPSATQVGKPLLSAEEAWNRPARRLPDHDPTTYINDGFDELQVYYAINSLFESLKQMGFTDPELSTRPFNAFLFDPDIGSQDNAYYTDDTINFTTYSKGAPNMARDNTTIWHELGHGVMDRLMGDQLKLADTGGLSEGMADFVAELVLQAMNQGKPFPGEQNQRIINNTGFYLTNEVHDDGEAYGGAMRDLLQASLERYGRPGGLQKVTDLILEAMRLSRDHPGLTAPEWFSHVLFADELGRPGVRMPGELKPLVLQALAGRNFRMDSGKVAEYRLTNVTDNEEVTDSGNGSRRKPIRVKLPQDGSVSYDLSAKIQGSELYSFQYPVQIKVSMRGGPLQGAIHWEGEEAGSQTYTLKSVADLAKFKVTARGTCDYVNREDGSCVDFVYIQVLNKGGKRPVAKKRFYLRVSN